MTAPDWKDAPDWANWRAQDEDGEWYWYEKQPSALHDQWYAAGSWMVLASLSEASWRETLQPRPE